MPLTLRQLEERRDGCKRLQRLAATPALEEGSSQEMDQTS